MRVLFVDNGFGGSCSVAPSAFQRFRAQSSCLTAEERTTQRQAHLNQTRVLPPNTQFLVSANTTALRHGTRLASRSSRLPFTSRAVIDCFIDITMSHEKPLKQNIYSVLQEDIELDIVGDTIVLKAPSTSEFHVDGTPALPTALQFIARDQKPLVLQAPAQGGSRKRTAADEVGPALKVARTQATSTERRLDCR
ncbi:hypothetical protein EJ03DRAFT_382325 [Teratosphaeria nubilosa]|uniref:Uncharacterized protein n=1 Tax=Teratosphaeria nubilosa TaxID=161662 RepID=A0A6G1LAP2_9PEZI|nr:hypothetical protein EJ03DRAFT_382325 [Teratosphaeria nubilosa]